VNNTHKLSKTTRLSNILSRVTSIFFFNRKFGKSRIPKWLRVACKSELDYENNAAIKVFAFCKRNSCHINIITQIYEQELNYEQKKLQIKHDYPHLPEVVKTDIAIAKAEKFKNLESILPKNVFEKYKIQRTNRAKKH
jgi:hypothetical protein